MQIAADPNAAQDVLGTAPGYGSFGTVAAIFANVPSPGDDPDVSGTGPIGYAAGVGALVTPSGGGFGADGGTASSKLVIPADGTLSGVSTTGGTQIFLYQGTGDAAHLILGRVGTEAGATDTANSSGTVAFALALDPATGKLVMAQYLSLSHPTGGASYDEPISLTTGALQVQVTYTDGDGDTASSSLNVGNLVQFQDDGISASATTAGTVLDDEGQAGGIAGGYGDVTGAAKTVSGDLTIGIGADGLKSVAFAASLTATGESGAVSPVQVVYVDPTTKVATLETINVAWTPSGNGGTLTGTSTHYGAGSPVFTLVVDVAGHYNFTLNAPLAQPLHDEPGAPVQTEYEDNLNLQFSFTATDGDNDTAASTLTITVDDDTPDVDVAGATSFNEGTTGTGTWTLTPGADGFGLVQVTVGATTKALSMTSSANTVTFGAGDGIAFGTLTVKADGTWSFASSPVASDQGLTFSVKVTDGDGDVDTDLHSLTVLNVNTLPTAGTQAVTVDEEGLANGIAGGPGDVSGQAITATGTLIHYFGADGPSTPASNPINFSPLDGGSHTTLVTDVNTLATVTSGGVALKYYWDGTGNTLYASTNTAPPSPTRRTRRHSRSRSTPRPAPIPTLCSSRSIIRSKAPRTISSSTSPTR